MTDTPQKMAMNGIWPSQSLISALESGILSGVAPDQVQPASVDLSLGETAYRLRASFLPGNGRTVAEALDTVGLHQISLKDGAVLETGCVYLIPLRESLALPANVAGLANPKSSTGRLDVFTRVIGDGAEAFDAVLAGYTGPLWIEVAPRTFPVLARTGDRLVQLRLRQGPHLPVRTETVSIDLSGSFSEDGRVGYRARRHSGLVDLQGVGAHAAMEYWDPLYAPNGELVLDPEEFYILASSEAVVIPEDLAAEMAPIAPEIGEFRAHYAGFFDPGFGTGGQTSRAVLEVRGRDVPFLLRDRQPVAKLVFEPMQAVPERLYGGGSNYQGQSLKLGKHFKG
jgi:dCTP deaminase